MAINNFTADGGSWGTVGNWSLGHVPDATEDVTVTGIVGASKTLTLSAASYCKSIDCRGAANAFTLSMGVNDINISGSITCKTGMSWTSSFGGVNILATCTLTSNGVTLSGVYGINISAGTTTLSGALTTGSLYVTATGTLATGNNAVTCTGLSDLATGTPTFTLGSSVIQCSTIDITVATITANTATYNLVPASNNIGITFVNGTVKMASAATCTGTFTLTKGTLDLNGKTITTGIFSSSNSNIRAVQDTAGGGKIVCTGLTGTIFNMATTTNLTVSNSPAVDIGTGALTQSADVTFATGGKTFGAVTITKHAGNYSCIVSGGPTFSTLTLQAADATYQYSSLNVTAGTQLSLSSAGGLTSAGSVSYPSDINSASAATHTISCASGTVTFSYTKISYSIATGGAIFNSFTTNGCQDLGSNTGWRFTSAGMIIAF